MSVIGSMPRNFKLMAASIQFQDLMYDLAVIPAIACRRAPASWGSTRCWAARHFVVVAADCLHGGLRDVAEAMRCSSKVP